MTTADKKALARELRFDRYAKGRLVSVPEWAWKVLANECKAVQRNGCVLTWTKGRGSGRAWYGPSNGRIHISACGHQATDLHILLHEIAHVNVGTNRGHDVVWAKEAVRLYKKYGLIEACAEGGSIYVHYAIERKHIQACYNRMQAAKAR